MKQFILIYLIPLLNPVFMEAQVTEEITSEVVDFYDTEVQDIRFINRTDELLYLAVAYMGYADGIKKTAIVTEGWYSIEPGKTAVPDLESQVLYYYVANETQSRAWEGEEIFYIDWEDDFTLSQLSMWPDEYFAEKEQIGFIRLEGEDKIILE